MKNIGHKVGILLFQLALTVSLFGQTTTTATYSSGVISTDFNTNVTTSSISACSADLLVNVPAGRYVTSVDIEYQIIAQGGAWQTEQRSYIECITTGTKEAAVSNGPAVNAGGTVNYNRTGLTFANGLVPAGGLTFRIHAFRTWGGSGCGSTFQSVTNSTYKVTVTHVAAPTCLPPTGVSVSNITSNSVDLSWTSGGATSWQLEYWPSTTPANKTILNVTTNPYTLSGLNSSTSYDFRLRDSCAVGNVSFWTSGSVVKTLCAAINAPWTENFDGADWVPAGFTNVGEIDTCFTRNWSNSLTWETGPPQFASGFSGPSSDHTSGSGKYIFSEVNAFGTTPDSAIITTPPIDLTALTIPELTYWYHMYGFNIGQLVVQVSDNGGSSYTTLVTKNGQQQNAKTDPWKEETVNLASYANKTIILRFLAIQPTFGTNSDVSIDDIDIHEQPTCPKPSNVHVITTTNNSVTLGWTSGGATNWQIEYGSAGFTPGTGTIINAASNPFTIAGLSNTSSYDFYVRDSCSATDVSAWSFKVTGNTICNVFSTPYIKTFDGPAWNRGTFNNDPGTMDTCWVRDVSKGYFIKTGPAFFTFSSGASVDHTTGTTSGKYFYSERRQFTGTADTAVVVTPLIDLSQLTNPQLSFWYHMFGADISGLNVYITNDFGMSYTQIYTRTGQFQSSATDAWKEAIVNLAAYANDTIRIKFAARDDGTGFSSDICIDDFAIEEQPTCPKPQDLTLIGVTNNSATLQWTSGGAANWNIEYGAPGFTPGNGTLVNANSNPFTVTGLSPNTAYDFYVRDSCGIGDVSLWVGKASDTTDCNPIAAPYVENFDGAQFTIGTFFFVGNMNSCWDREYGRNFMWQPTQTNTTFNTGPNGDHTTGSGKYMQSNRFFGGPQTPSTEAVVYTPLIDLSTLTTPELSFWYHMFGADIDSLVVEVFDGSTWTNVMVLSGPQQSSKAAAWKEAIVNISSFANDTIKVAFKSYRSSTFAFAINAAIDDIDIHEQPSCPKPSALMITGTTASSVTLAWTSGGATNWQIEYGPPGFTLGTGTKVNAGTNPFTVTGLNSSTTYDFYVRDSCGAADLSDWLGATTGSTDCLPLLAPFTENFDGSQWMPAVNFTDTGGIAQCWERNPLINYFFIPGPPPFPPFGTGPAVDHTTGSGQFIFAESIFGGGTAPFDAFIESPLIDLSSLTTPELSFWYHMYGSGLGTLVVEVDNGSGYTSVYTRNGQDQTSNNDPWKEVIVSLAAYANDTIKLRFKATKATFSALADLAIDDVDIHEQPSCPKPSNVSVVPTSDGFVVSWTTGGAANWQIEYGPPGFSPGAGTIVNAATNPFTLTGLNSQTAYDVYVRDSCGAGDVSAWAGPAGDTTLCSPFLAPFSENFDGADWVIGPFVNDPGSIDPCWNRSDFTGYYWRVEQNGTSSFGTGPAMDHTTGSGKFMYTENFGGNRDTSLFYSPLIDLSGLTNPELRFWYHMYGADIDELEVQVFAGTSWTTVTTIVGQQQASDIAAWDERIVSLSSFVNDTVRVRFIGKRTQFGFFADLAIDDFWIGEAPTCPRPNNVSITAVTTTSITISWTTGGATNWLVGYKPAGAPGPLTIVPVNTNPFTINGLSPSSSYEIYVKDSCAAGDVSLWEGPTTASTACGVVSAPWIENFNSNDWVSGAGAANLGNQINACWSRPSSTNPNFGTRIGTTTTFQSGPSGGYGGTGKYIYTEASGAAGTGQITSPEIAIPASLMNPRLKFAYHMYGTGIVSLTVKISTGGAFTNQMTITGQQQFSSAAAWKFDSISLNSFKGDTIRIRFEGINNQFNGDISIDEVQVISDPTNCADPANLSFTNVTYNSADVNWITGASSSEIEVVPAGQPQGSGTLYTGVTTPFSITGLQPNSAYLIYVRDSCNIAYSNWVFDSLFTLPCPAVGAGFSHSSNILSVSFNSSATTNADSVYWQFGDGTDTSIANPKHAYAAGGNYVVTLIAMNMCDADTLIDTITVCDTLLANFVKSQQGDTVVFDASVSKGGNLYYWDLGDGTDTTGQLVQHVYTTNGSKIVKLIVVNACGDSASIQRVITVCAPPVASWTYTILSSGGSGMQVQFDGSASINASTYDWDFGDGNSISGPVQPIHTYLTPGLFYIVKLTVTNQCGDVNVRRVRLSEVGISELEIGQGIDLYPNPASDIVILEWEAKDAQLETVHLIDAAGKLVLEDHPATNSEKMEIDVSSLKSGVYMVRVITRNGVSTQQLIIE